MGACCSRLSEFIIINDEPVRETPSYIDQGTETNNGIQTPQLWNSTNKGNINNADINLTHMNQNIQNNYNKNKEMDESIAEKSSIVSVPSISQTGLHNGANKSVELNSSTIFDDNDSRRPSLLYLANKMTSEEIDKVEKEMKNLYAELQHDLSNHINHCNSIQSNWPLQEPLTQSDNAIKTVTTSIFPDNQPENNIVSVQSNENNNPNELPRRPSLIQPDVMLTKEEYDIQKRELEEQLRTLELQISCHLDGNATNNIDITIDAFVEFPDDKTKPPVLTIPAIQNNVNNEAETREMMRALEMLKASCSDNNKNNVSDYNVASYNAGESNINNQNNVKTPGNDPTENERIAMLNELQKLMQQQQNSNKAQENTLTTNNDTIASHEDTQ